MALDPQKKDDIFRNPEKTEIRFGRQISTVTLNNETFSAMQSEIGKDSFPLICRVDDKGEKSFIRGPSGIVHQPSVCVANESVYTVWNQVIDDKWFIRCAKVDLKTETLKDIQTVYKSFKICHPPVMAFYDGRLYIAFTSIKDESLDIHIAYKADGTWSIKTPFENPGIDRYRPRLSANADGLYMVWDQYKDKKYEIALAVFNGKKCEIIKTVGDKNQRWFTPRIVASENGEVYICWVVLQAVTDKLGIIDHYPYVMAAKYQKGRFEYLEDEENAENRYMIADLREGLLASRIYKGHIGLRRNPQLALDDNGRLYVFWEMRKETMGSVVYGHLTGRKLISDNQWSEPCIYSSSGYCYSVPENMSNDKIPCTYYYFESEGFDIIRNEKLNLSNSEKFEVASDKWKRWKNISIKPQSKPSETIDLDNEEYKLVWADTHCHSNFSPDAEGELDELVNFAKDTAGLDVVTLIDNDYYPHKSLTEAEWRIHGCMSEYFTKEGEFVWLPGYEFTYHRSDLEPDFNHRCVIYPRKGGKLLRRIDPESNTDSKIITELKKTKGMAYPHHCSYKLVDNTVERNVEVCSSWRVCIEETVVTKKILKTGCRLGFIGSSDTHRMVPGLAGARTGLYVKKLTPEELFDAYHNRRIIATQGFNIFMDFRVSDAFIGQQIQTNKTPVLKGIIKAPEKIDYVEVIRDGDPFWWENPENERFSFEIKDSKAAKGEHFYYLKVKLKGDPSFNVDADPANNFPKSFEQNSRYPHNLARAKGVFAWTSPVWMDYR